MQYICKAVLSSSGGKNDRSAHQQDLGQVTDGSSLKWNITLLKKKKKRIKRLPLNYCGKSVRYMMKCKNASWSTPVCYHRRNIIIFIWIYIKRPHKTRITAMAHGEENLEAGKGDRSAECSLNILFGKWSPLIYEGWCLWGRWYFLLRK